MNCLKIYLHLFLLLMLTHGSCSAEENVLLHCPETFISPSEAPVYRQVTPRGNTNAGKFLKIDGVTKIEGCIVECCKTVNCHMVFMFRSTCYLIECSSDDLCQPVHRHGKKFAESYMVRLRSVDKEDVGFSQIDDHFDNLLGETDMRTLLKAESLLNDYAQDDESISPSEENIIRKQSPITSHSCLRELKECPENEDCIGKNSRARQGVCKCVDGYIRDHLTGRCIRSIDENDTLTSTTNSAITKVSLSGVYGSSTSTTSRTTTAISHLVVSAGENKIIQLPENEVTLSAFVLPSNPNSTSENEQKYHYEWILISHPEGDDMGTMGDKNSAILKLTSLKEGVYIFKIAVSAEDGYGESFVNVTVLPPKRINKPPVAIINPANQTVKLPNTITVLDGSASTDDDKIVKYHWEQVSAPINYQPELTDTSTLQLKNLVQGFYCFMLTVTDSDGAVNSTYANISVIKETDYPPTSNAGPDVIIYLPQTEVVLNGNLSTDDKGIKSWEWTKGTDNNKAVDLQNTHTPYLHLSNLGIGMYTFKLKVTDTADQSSVAEVRVFVKEEDNAEPVADAGPNQEIVLPNDEVTLDGTKSHDDLGIKIWSWKQLSGPNQATLSTPNQNKTIANGLTKGVYVFQLTVYDEKKANSSKTVTVTVKQTENKPPRANAGGDKTIQLPTTVVFLNGSGSSDDLGIVSYKWTRDPSSLAAGVILENSDDTPILRLTNLIPGRYLFQLKVTDNQGSSSTDTASLIVKGDAQEKNDVEMEINSDIFWFTEENKETLAKKLALLLHDKGEIRIIIKSITAARYSGRVILVFNVEKISESDVPEILSGPDIVYSLKRKLQTDSALLDFGVIVLDTVICQRNCSGHGSCDQATKRCICEAFWMEDFFRYNFRDRESNCDWSILYVIIILFTTVLSTTGLIWAMICVCRRMRFRRPRKRHYTLLKNMPDKESFAMLRQGKKQASSLMMSESELESDTVFDQKQLNGKLNGHQYYPPNGVVHHPPRKVRT